MVVTDAASGCWADDSRWGTWISALAMRRMLLALGSLCQACNVDLGWEAAASVGPGLCPRAAPEAQLYLGALHFPDDKGHTRRVLIRDALLDAGGVPPLAPPGDDLSSDNSPAEDAGPARRRGVPPDARAGVNVGADPPPEEVVPGHNPRLDVIRVDGSPVVRSYRPGMA